MSIRPERWALTQPFAFGHRIETASDVLVVEVHERGLRGWGEGSPDGGDVMELVSEARRLQSAVEAGASRADLLTLLPAGATRNAIDCALWDLEAKLSGQRAWQLAGLPESRELITAYTIGLDTPDRMATIAARERHRPLLKLKLDGHDDVARVTAIRDRAPEPRLIVDANGTWTRSDYLHALAPFARLGVEVIEQPFAADQDEQLRQLPRPIAIAADESFHGESDLERMHGLYDLVNLKLDKTGGLTAALALAHEALARRFKIMVGCMTGTSLAMAPAHLLGQLCDVVDLDAPLLHETDRTAALRYQGSAVSPPEPDLWG